MSLSKKLRFEVFKRDKFTCQYCGAKAPDVVLHADHVEPASKGGPDTLLNLITACADCNGGKGARRLTDDSVVVKQRAQLEELQERQEQIAMMVDWQRSLASIDDSQVQQAADFWCDLSEWIGVTEAGRKPLRTAIRRHGLDEVLTAMRIVVDQYVTFDTTGAIDHESTLNAFRKIPAVCRVRASEREKPYLKDILYIRGIVRNRFTYHNPRTALDLLETACELGGHPDVLGQIAREERNWTTWTRAMDEYIADMRVLRG